MLTYTDVNGYVVAGLGDEVPSTAVLITVTDEDGLVLSEQQAI